MHESSEALRELLALLQSASPLLRCTAAGLLGALANLGLDDRPVALPRVEEGRLYLGFLGNLMVSLAMAYVVDQDFRTSFFAAVCGTTTLRALKQRIEEAFEHERKELEDDRESR